MGLVVGSSLDALYIWALGSKDAIQLDPGYWDGRCDSGIFQANKRRIVVIGPLIFSGESVDVFAAVRLLHANERIGSGEFVPISGSDLGLLKRAKRLQVVAFEVSRSE